VSANWTNVGASHIRGRVIRISTPRRSVRRARYTDFCAPRTYYAVEVVNTSTGKVLNHDNGFPTLAAAMDDCVGRVRSARDAWGMGLRHADLRAAR
jgi:hypothetical protein